MTFALAECSLVEAIATFLARAGQEVLGLWRVLAFWSLAWKRLQSFENVSTVPRLENLHGRLMVRRYIGEADFQAPKARATMVGMLATCGLLPPGKDMLCYVRN